MKKLSLKKLKLEANDMLQRNDLKSVFGGYGGYDDGQPCSILATASVYEEAKHYGAFEEEADRRKAWDFYYYSCTSSGHNNFVFPPVFL